MEEQFLFKVASVGGENNTIIVSVQGDAILTEADIKANNARAYRLAEQLALWLTPATTRKLREALSSMDY